VILDDARVVLLPGELRLSDLVLGDGDPQGVGTWVRNLEKTDPLSM
jgi:hypothetical protein